MIELIIDPVPKPRMTVRDKWAHRSCVDRYYAFKTELTCLCNLKGFELPDKFKIEFLMPMPDGWNYKRKLEMVGKPHKQRPDLDNLVKAVLDCLKKEDKEIYHIDMSKIWWYEGKIIFYEIQEV